MRRAIASVGVLLLAGCAQRASVSPAPPEVSTVALSDPIASMGRLGGVATGPDGAVYVANFHGSVWRVDPDGTTTGLTNALQGSSGNAVDRAGRLLQASFLDGRILAVDPSGEVTTLVDKGLDGPVGLAVAATGDVVVCNCRANTLSAVAPSGAVRTLAVDKLFDCPNGITAGPDDALYVVNFNNSHVLRVDAAGEVSVVATLSGGGNAHIVWARGAFYVTRIDTNEIVRVEPNGSFARWAGTGAVGLDDGPIGEATFARPNGIAASPDGRYLFVNNLDGEWRADAPAELVLRRVGPIAEDVPPEDVEIPDRPIESIGIHVGDLTFDALAAGPADGPLVLLLHGFPQTAAAFDAQLRVLAEAGYRAVAPNQRGYSPGARPAEVSAYAMPNLVADVVGLADALGADRFDLVGHDWGGAVAWVTATAHADRVRSLTVLSTPHFQALTAARASAASDQGQRSVYFSTFAAPGAEAGLLADDAAGLRAIYGGLDPAAIDRYVEALGNPEALAAALAWYGAAFGGSGGASSAPPPAPSAGPPPVRVPTLYVWSTEDRAFGRDAALATAQHVSGPYEFEVIDGIGHWLPELAAEQVSRLILDHLGRPW